MDNDIYKLASDKIDNLKFVDCSYMVKMARDAVLDSHKEIEEPIIMKAEALVEKINAEEQYRNNILNTLMSIEKNTAGLNTIVELVKNSNENQDEILKIINELLLISKEKDKEKARTKFTASMKKITDLGENADTANKLYTFGTTIYTILSSSGIV